MKRTHFQLRPLSKAVACGADLWQAPEAITRTLAQEAVTCKGCKRTWDYRETLAIDDPRRRIPA